MQSVGGGHGVYKEHAKHLLDLHTEWLQCLATWSQPSDRLHRPGDIDTKLFPKPPPRTSVASGFLVHVLGHGPGSPKSWISTSYASKISKLDSSKWELYDNIFYFHFLPSLGDCALGADGSRDKAAMLLGKTRQAGNNLKWQICIIKSVSSAFWSTGAHWHMDCETPPPSKCLKKCHSSDPTPWSAEPSSTPTTTWWVVTLPLPTARKERKPPAARNELSLFLAFLAPLLKGLHWETLASFLLIQGPAKGNSAFLSG